MAFTQIRVHHQFKNIDGSAASGVVAFRLSQRISNGGVTYTPQVPTHATLNGTGDLTVTLPANNDPTTTPKGSNYIVTFFVNTGISSGDEVAIIIPHTAAAGAITLGTLLPKQEGRTL